MAQAGDRVGEYVLDTRVGGGTFGEVWRAHHHVWTDQLVAIKIPTDPQFLRDLQREGVAIHGLVHPNIVRAIGFDPYAPVPYLTMEYVPGTSLRTLVQARTASIPDAVAIMQQVLAGLGYAHEQKVIHRDVKPENILIHERAAREGFNVEGLVKVTDFGLGTSTGNSTGSIAYSASMNSPQAREIAGTLDYMAPEQRSGAESDARVDLYACGVVFYELLTGEKPAGTEVPSDLNRNVPKQLDDVFRRSYARLDKRFASAEEFAAALRAAPILTPPPLPKLMPLPPIPRQPTSIPAGQCPQCRRSVDPKDQFCMFCGRQLVANVRRCPRCGAYPDSTDRFCIFCGETLTPQSVPA
jgi:serine/threonine-protein kinase